MRIERDVRVDASRDEVWDVVANIADHAHVLTGVTRWEPVNDEKGVGARFDVRMQVGAAQLGSVIEITEWVEGCELAWTSMSGIDHRGRFTIREAEDGKTRLRFRLTYAAPGGLFGLVAGRVAAPTLQAAVDATARSVKQRAEGETELITRDAPSSRRSLGAFVDTAESVIVLRRAGLLRSRSPIAIASALDAYRRYGFTIATAVALAAADDPDRVAVIDDDRSLTYGELEQRSTALAVGLADEGVGEGDPVGVLYRNERTFVEVVVALAKIGADALLLNTSFSDPQRDEVLEREGAVRLLDGPVESLIEKGEGRRPPGPSKPGRQIILTSGTTGTPKGARRGGSTGLEPLVAFLSRVPLRAGETTVIAAPLFHAWGFAHLALGLVLNATLVVRKKFDPETTLADVAEHRVSTLVAVPVMLQRILDVESERPDTSSLRVVPLSGSALPGQLATTFMDEFGDILYNLYGSTEVAWATIAGPADLRLVPGAAGRPPRGTIVKLLDEHGVEVAPGETGTISSATRSASRATRAARTRTGSAASSAPVTAATGTGAASSSWRGARTT